MIRKVRRLLISPVILLYLLALFIFLFFVYRNNFYHLFNPADKYEYNFSESGIAVAVSYEQELYPQYSDRGRRLKISVPINYQPAGCEFVSAAAILHYSTVPKGVPGNVNFKALRYLLRFEYDLKNRRCESHDLLLNNNDYPADIRIQLLRTNKNNSQLIEKPEKSGIRLSFLETATDNSQISASAEEIPAAYPFLTESITTLAPKFSFSVAEASPEMIISPEGSLYARLYQEITSITKNCREQQNCERIQAAVAKITDPRMLTLFEEARLAGAPVELITSEIQRSYSSRVKGEFNFAYSPWIWIPGAAGRFSDIRARLPMHAKFVILGSRLVISSNANYSLDSYPDSREAAMVYQGQKAVNVFENIYSFIRSNVFLPISVNLSDDIQILLNAEKSRQHSPWNRKPYLAIKTEEGITASAYGILFEILRRNSGKLRLAMSPISNSCARYQEKYCLFDILQQYAASNRLELYSNFFFYSLNDPRVYQGDNFWPIDQSLDLELTKKNFLSLYRKLHKPHNSIRLMSKYNSIYSLHHERYGILGDEKVLFGSANYARSSTINTVEIIKSPQLVGRVKAEIDTFNEPYKPILIEDQKNGTALNYQSGCNFIFERDLLSDEVIFTPKNFTRDVLAAELKNQYGEVLTADYQLSQPVFTREDLLDRSRYLNIKTTKTDIGEEFQSYSSYICLTDKRTNITRLVLLPVS